MTRTLIEQREGKPSRRGARTVRIKPAQNPCMHSRSVDGHLVFTYRQIMELVLRYTGRRRPIVSLPYSVGTLQGLVLEQLPPNLFTLTRAQVC